MGNRKVTPSWASPSAYAGGYSEIVKRRLENVALPDKIKCKNCKKFRNSHAYSNRQLDIFRNALLVQGQNSLTAGHATCRTCTGGQIMELKCCICEVTKDLDQFAINQRKEHENARCLGCVQGHKDAEPITDENKLITDGELPCQTMTSHIGSSMASTRRLAPSDAPGNGSSAAGVTDNSPFGGGVWVEPERQDPASSRGRALNHSSYGSDDQGRLVGVGGTGSSVHSAWASIGVYKSLVAPNVHTDKDRKFAKIPACRPDAPETPLAPRAPEVRGNIDHSDDEHSDEDPNDFL